MVSILLQRTFEHAGCCVDLMLVCFDTSFILRLGQILVSLLGHCTDQVSGPVRQFLQDIHENYIS